ncbi:hypothetical protein Tco_1166690 [Tanacetum coccineum]
MTKKPRKAKWTTEISQSSGPIPFVTDKIVIKEWEDIMERAATTTSSLEAEQDSGNINRTQSMATLNESFPQGTDLVLVYATRHLLTAVQHKLMLPGITSYCWNLEGGVKFLMYPRFVQVFLDKQLEGMSKHKWIYVTPSHTKKICANMKSERKKVCSGEHPLFQTMMVQAPKDMGKDSAAPTDSHSTPIITQPSSSNSIKYALTVNPTVYESCIKQFWTTAKAKTVNGECQIQALVDKKKVIITEKSVRRDLMLEDAQGTECLPNDVIFEQLALIGAKTTTWNEFSSTMASAIILFLDKQVEGMSKHKGIYVTPSHTKKIFANMKRKGKGFSRRITPLFQTIMVQALEYMGKDSAAPTDSYSTPIITQPLSSKPQKKKSKRKQMKDSGSTEPIPDKATNDEPISTPSCDPPQSAKTAQAKEIASLKKIVKQLEKRKKSSTSGLKRLRKVGSTRRVKSSNDVSLGAQEDASKQGSKIVDLNADAEVTLIDETQERFDEEMLFDVQGEEVVAEKEVAEKEVSAADSVTTTGEVVTTASATTTVDELTLA